MFLRIVARSLRNRKARIVVAVLAVLLDGSLVSALVNVSMEVGSKMGRELRAYGANIAVSPQAATAPTGMGGIEFGTVTQEKYLSERDVELIKSGDELDEIVAYAPYLYGLAEMGGKKVVLSGARFQATREISPWWRVTGEWAEDLSGGRSGQPSGLVGVNVARELKLSAGDNVMVRYGGEARSIRISGLVESGGPEEDQVFVPLLVAQELLGKPGLVSVAQVGALSSKRPLSEVARSIGERVPEAQAKVIGQIADAEASILAKIQLLMALVAFLVLVASGLAVGSTMTASVLERTREIGLMKALGAGDRRIAALFMAESASIAGAGGILGYVAGLGLAQIVGQSVFGSAISPHFLAAVVTLLVALLVCLLASAVPVRRALAIDPALTLRGE